MRNRRTPARVTALLLTVALVFGVLCGGAFAATIDTVQQYDTYVCLGDSIAAGFGDYAPTTYCFERVPEAYHSIVADAVYNALKDYYGMALDILFQTANTMHMMATVLQTLPEKMAHGYQHFFQNWEPLINDLHTLAPNATIVAVGLYNPFNESKLTEYSALTIGRRQSRKTRWRSGLQTGRRMLRNWSVSRRRGRLSALFSSPRRSPAGKPGRRFEYGAKLICANNL